MCQMEADLIKAIQYINQSGIRSIKPRAKTIKSFLKGSGKSPFYKKIFIQHEDICGKYPNIKLKEIKMTLNELEMNNKIKLIGEDYKIIKDFLVDEKIKKKSKNEIVKTNEDAIKHWIIKANPKMYNHEASFIKNGHIDWKQNKNSKIQVGDIVYVYITNPVQRIKIKAIVEKTGMIFSEITDDKEFWINMKKYYSGKKGYYMRLTKLDIIDNKALSYIELLKKGMSDLKSPLSKINNLSLLKYINKEFGIEDNNFEVENPRNIPEHIKSLVYNRDKGKCVKCGSRHKIQYDHIIPYSKGGTSTDADNIQLLCESCNLEKSNKIK